MKNQGMDSNIEHMVFLVIIMFFLGCSGEDVQLPQNGLDTDSPQLSELDTWVREQFTLPYNIEVIYKTDGQESEDNVKSLLDIILLVWIEGFNSIHGGEEVLKLTAPRKLLLEGTEATDFSGLPYFLYLETYQTAVVYGIDTFEADNIELIRNDHLKRLIHAHVHILTQTKPIKSDFGDITPNGYTRTWFNPTNVGDEIAWEQGFISKYAKNNKYEDFIETATWILTKSREDLDAIVNGINNEGAKTNLKKKINTVENYFKKEWGIDIFELQSFMDGNLQKVPKMTDDFH